MRNKCKWKSFFDIDTLFFINAETVALDFCRIIGGVVGVKSTLCIINAVTLIKQLLHRLLNAWNVLNSENKNIKQSNSSF